MKVVVLGGYGVFGTRLVDLLARDGHEVIVAGRSVDKAREIAARYGATPLRLDRRGDLAPLWAMTPEVVVDAAGPFHAYGTDPYAFARACIAQGAHYLDLADDPAFCAGITCLEAQAQAAGVFALSGVSSVPAISSAAVAGLGQGAEIDTISTAILPGNRAPRGRAVVESILHQCGRPFDVTVDGQRRPMRSWSRPEVFDLGQRIIRKGWMIEVPDHRLFPSAFGARTVLFRAGLELGVMNHGLAAFSWLRRRWPFRIPGGFISAVMVAARMLWPFGTDEGGMSVAVTCRVGERWERRLWRLVARAGEGPYIPAVAARVVLCDPGRIAPGARPCVAEIDLAAVIEGVADLAVETTQVAEPVEPIFPLCLRRDFNALPATLRAVHEAPGARILTGVASVERGHSIWSRLIGRVVGFPKATAETPVSVMMMPQDGGEVWERRFGDQTFRSVMALHGGQMTERFGPLTFTLGLRVQDGTLQFPIAGGRLGPFPLPKMFLPQSIAREYEAEGRFHFDVTLKAPITGGLVVRYHGWLSRLGDGDEEVVEGPGGAKGGDQGAG